MILKEKYTKIVIPELKKKFGYTNIFSIPRLDKAVINVGLNSAKQNEQILAQVKDTIRQITGQQPVPTKARKSIAGFKIREGMIVGMKATLRGEKMYSLVSKLINVALPRIRDFRGLSLRMVDRQGNISIGFREHLAFPEINPDAVDTLHGLEVVVSTTAKTREEGLEFFRLLGFPFKE